MDLLLEKYNDYARLIGCRAVYELENGLSIEYTYRKDNFVHLIGLTSVDNSSLDVACCDSCIDSRCICKNFMGVDMYWMGLLL